MGNQSLDLYGLSKNRDAYTISRFIKTYVDLDEEEYIADRQITLVPLGRTEYSYWYVDRALHEYSLAHDPEYRAQYYERDSEPAPSLREAIQKGLDYPRRSFTLYLAAKMHPDISQAIMSFTVDDLIVFGLQTPYPPKRTSSAKALLRSLIQGYDCHMALAAVETPPPMSELDFRQQGRGHGIAFFDKERGKPLTFKWPREVY